MGLLDLRRGQDGHLHFLGDDCGTHEVYPDGFLACGQDFMAGTICSLPAGHLGPDGATCHRCGGDWVTGTCTCYVATDDDDDL